MGNELKEVIDILEKVYHVPSCFMVSNDERWKALDKIMTTYAKNRNEILKEMNKK